MVQISDNVIISVNVFPPLCTLGKKQTKKQTGWPFPNLIIPLAVHSLK